MTKVLTITKTTIVQIVPSLNKEAIRKKEALSGKFPDRFTTSNRL